MENSCFIKLIKGNNHLNQVHHIRCFKERFSAWDKINFIIFDKNNKIPFVIQMSAGKDFANY